MSEQRKIKVVKGGIDRDTIPADECERRQRELKKIKDELLTLARRVETLASDEATELKTK